MTWTLPGYRLDGTGTDITGDVIAVQTPSGQVSACCVISRLPGAIVSRRRRRAVTP